MILAFRAKGGRSRAAAEDDDACQVEVDYDVGSHGSPANSSARVNRKGLHVLTNNVVSMRLLDLAARVPTKTHDREALRLLNCCLPLSKVYTLLSFIIYGRHTPVEKHKDVSARLILMHSSAPYCLNSANLQTVLEADPDELSAYLIGLAKNAQQINRYALYGTVCNWIGEKVLTPRAVYPSDDIKVHLGLVGEHAKKSIMDL